MFVLAFLVRFTELLRFLNYSCNQLAEFENDRTIVTWVNYRVFK